MLIEKAKQCFPAVGISFCFVLLLGQDCSRVATQNLSNRNRQNHTNRSSSTVPYQILSRICTKEKRCYLMIYLDSKYFLESDLLTVSNSISGKFKDVKGLTVNFFDDRELAKSYASGKKEQLNLFADVRAKYVRGGGQEFLIFSPDASRLGDSENPVKIEIGNK